MSRNNTGNPIGSKAFPDFEDNVKNLDQAVNAPQDTFQDRLGKSRLTWAGMESGFGAGQVSREQRFGVDQSARDQEFRTFIASSGYQLAGDYAAGIEITQYNQIIRDENGEFWRVSGQIDLPYTTTGAGLPEGNALTPLGDAVLRQNLDGDLENGLGSLLVRGSVIYVDTIADLQALPTSGLVDGQAAVVHGSEVRWSASASAWQPIRGITVEAFGAVGDGVTDDSAAIISAAAFSDYVLFSRKQYVAQGLPIRTGLIYEGVSGETEIRLPATPSDHLFKTTGTTDTITSGGLKNLKLDGGGTTTFNGADFSSIFDEQLTYWIAEDCWFSGFNRGFNGTNNDREPAFRNCRFLNNVIGAYGGEHPLFIGCDFRSNDIGLSGRLNDLKVSNCKFTYNRIGVTPDRDAGRSLTNSLFNACGFFRNSELAILVGTDVTVSNCRIVGNGEGSVGIHSFTGIGLIATGNNFSQVGFDACIKITREGSGITYGNNIQANKFSVDCAAAVQSDATLENSTISNNMFGGPEVATLACISVANCTNSAISSNHYYGSGVFYQTSGFTHNVTFSGNELIINSSEAFIRLGSVPALQGNVFTGNLIRKLGAGLAPVFSGSLARTTITGNRFSGNAKIDLGLITSTEGTILVGNTGLATTTNGVFTFDSGETSDTFSFVLDWPAERHNVALSPLTNSASQAQVHVTDVDNDTGTVTCTSQAPMGAGAIFAYKIVAGDV